MLRIFFPPSVRGEAEIELVPAVRRGIAGYRDNTWNIRYRELFAEAQRHFVETDVNHAQVIFYPHMYAPGTHAAEAVEVARARALPLVFQRTGDWHDPIGLPYGVVYRHAIFASERVPNERAMPALCEDMLLDRPGGVPIRRYEAVPQVGFRGYVGNRPLRMAYRLLGRRQKALGLEVRGRVLDQLAAASGLSCMFTRNLQFMGGSSGILHKNSRVARRVRADYVDSLLSCDYTLCVRGAGNFSYRFYEVLSAGRIPIYVNTNTVLPYEEEIDWKQHCVWVEEHELQRIGEKVLEFHRALDAASFESLQLRNRQLWEDYLRPLAFYRRALGKAAANDGIAPTLAP